MRKLKQTTECTYSKNKYTIAFRNITDHNHEITDRVWQASFKCVCALSQNRSSLLRMFKIPRQTQQSCDLTTQMTSRTFHY